MVGGDGIKRRCHLLYACFVGDYPEQVLVTCCTTGDCVQCTTPHNELGELSTPEGLRGIGGILHALDKCDDDPETFRLFCKDNRLKPVVEPFWKDMPYVHIYRSITPDVLHQLYQGVVKHVIGWVIDVYGSAEIDARCRRIPPNHNIHLFLKGISALSRVTGQEHAQMCSFILGLVIDIPLEDNKHHIVSRALRALLDFLYLAQYPVHNDSTLKTMEDSLIRFHDNKHVFVALGIRQHFNIPKLHFASHYIRSIRYFGTTDNFNTEYTERLHIDLAKDAYNATNRKDEFAQMATWLERKEKMARHEKYIQWFISGSPPPARVDWLPPGLHVDRALKMTKHPSVAAAPIERIEAQYGATHFRADLARFVVSTNYPNISRAQFEREVENVRIPCRTLPVWHRIKFVQSDPFTRVESTADSVHVQPARVDTRHRYVPARFDTVLVNSGLGEDIGIKGMSILLIYDYVEIKWRL
jgi:hypothetical protein